MSFRLAVTTWYKVMDTNTKTPSTLTNPDSDASRLSLMLRSFLSTWIPSALFRVSVFSLLLSPAPVNGYAEDLSHRSARHQRMLPTHVGTGWGREGNWAVREGLDITPPEKSNGRGGGGGHGSAQLRSDEKKQHLQIDRCARLEECEESRDCRSPVNR